MSETFQPREARSSGLRVRLTRPERLELEALAGRLGMNRSDVIRLGLELVRAKVKRADADARKGG